MAKKILSVMLILVLSLGVAVTAFGCKSELEEKYKQADADHSPYSSATKIEELEGFNVIDKAANLVWLRKNNADDSTTHKVFNLNTGKVVATHTVEAGDMFGYDLLEVKALGTAVFGSHSKKSTETDWTRAVYDAAGNEIGSTVSLFESFVYLDLVKLDTTYYRVNADGSMVKAIELTELNRFNGDILKFKVADNYYGKSAGIIYVFDGNGNLISYYTLPDYAEEVKWFVLADGNILVQSVYEKDAYAEDYDYLDGDRFGIEHKLVNYKNGEAKDVKDSDKPLYIGSVSSVGVMGEDGILMDGYEGSIKNFAVATDIVNKRLAEDGNYEITDGGKLEKIEDFIPAQKEIKVFNGHYFVSSKVGQIFLYDKEGKLVGEVSGMNGILNDKFLFTAKAIYDYSLNKVLDLNGYAVKDVLESTVVLSKVNAETGKTEYFLLKEGASPVKIGDEDNYIEFDGDINKYYVIENTDGKLDCYSETGTLLVTFESAPTYLGATEDNSKLLIKVGVSYYYVA